MSAAAMILTGLIAAGAAAEEANSDLLVGLALLVTIPLTARSLQLGVTLNDEEVVVRNFLRTRRFRVSDVDRFEVVPNHQRVPSGTVGVIRTSGRTTRITGLALPEIGRFRGPSLRRLEAMNEDLLRRP